MSMNDEQCSIIPFDQRCIWMDAGLISYKICDRAFECDECAFDAVMKHRIVPSETKKIASGNSDQKRPSDTSTTTDLFARICHAYLKPLVQMKIPKDRLYSPYHSWIKDEDHLVICGIDHVVSYLCEPLKGLTLREVKTDIQIGEPYAWIATNGGTLALRSPVQGIIIETNRLLSDHPSVLSKDPFFAGWIVKIKPFGPDTSASLLFNDVQYVRTIERDVSSLTQNFMDAYGQLVERSITTLCDGGQPIEDVRKILGASLYFRTIFSLLSV